MRNPILLLMAVIAALVMQTTSAYAQQSQKERIKEHEERIRQILEVRQRERKAEAQSQEAVTTANDHTSTMTPGGYRIAHDIRPYIEHNNRQKFNNFYYKWEPQEATFRGEEQEYSIHGVHLQWTLKNGDRTLQCNWQDNAEVQSIQLPEESLNLHLRNGRNCFLIEINGTDVKVSHWIQETKVYLATNVFIPPAGVTGENTTSARTPPQRLASIHTITISPDFPQEINDWKFYFDEDGASILAQNLQTSGTTQIGSKEKDSRPVGEMHVAIEALDNLTSVALLNISNAVYPHTTLATFSPPGPTPTLMRGPGKMTVAEALNRLSELYKFSLVQIDDQLQQVLETRDFNTPLQNHGNGSLLTYLEGGLGKELIPEIIDRNQLTVRMSSQLRADLFEKPELVKILADHVKLNTKVYTLSRLSAETVQPAIQALLANFYLLDESPRGVDAEKIISGRYYSVYKSNIIPKFPHNLVKETLIADDKSGSLIVTATDETHQKIQQWLEQVDGSMKETALAPNQPAPERRRLQAVLLQGGTAGTTSPIENTNYDPAVPAQYGMTPDDLKILGFDGAIELGRGLVDLVATPGEIGTTQVKLGQDYPVTIQYRDERTPYLIIDATLKGDTEEPLAQNTIMLEKNKPAFLGVTNLSGAIILVLTWMEE